MSKIFALIYLIIMKLLFQTVKCINIYKIKPVMCIFFKAFSYNEYICKCDIIQDKILHLRKIAQCKKIYNIKPVLVSF